MCGEAHSFTLVLAFVSLIFHLIRFDRNRKYPYLTGYRRIWKISTKNECGWVEIPLLINQKLKDGKFDNRTNDICPKEIDIKQNQSFQGKNSLQPRDQIEPDE